MNIAKQAYTRLWRGTLVAASLALLAYLLYFHKLGTLLPGYAEAEIHAQAAAADWHRILDNPFNAPYKVLVWLGTAILHQGMLATRVIAACFGIIAVWLFYLIARLRYSFWTACIGTVLFGTSAGFLHAARLGTGIVLQLSILAFLWCVLWYRARPNHRVFIGYVTTIVFASLWYVPGMIWFELFGLILLYRSIGHQLKVQSKLHLSIWAGLYVAIIAPLIWAIVQTPRLALAIAGLPQNLSTLSEFPRNLLDTVMAIGVRSDGDPLLWVGHAPLLNVVELCLLVLGIYVAIRRIRTTGSTRSVFLLGSTVLATILISLGSTISFVYLIPLLYIFILAGVHNLLSQWLVVFPRNPIARATGITIICVMLGFSVLYQVRSYFVAWPHNIETRATFSHNPKL